MNFTSDESIKFKFFAESLLLLLFIGEKKKLPAFGFDKDLKISLFFFKKIQIIITEICKSTEVSMLGIISTIEQFF